MARYFVKHRDSFNFTFTVTDDHLRFSFDAKILLHVTTKYAASRKVK